MAFDLTHILNFLKRYKLYVIGALALVLLAIALFSIFGSSIKNMARPDLVMTVPEMGGLPDLAEAMKKNPRLRERVNQVLAVDEAALFSNYKTIDNVMTEILFLWIGLSSEEMQKLGREKSAETFIRRYYFAPLDEPIKNNPYFGKRPWYDLFHKIKAKLLMQGHGYKIFDGVAFYDNRDNKMKIKKGLSIEYIEGLAEFIKTQPQKSQKGYINNYLFFVDNTLGLKNLNEKERKALKNMGFLK